MNSDAVFDKCPGLNLYIGGFIGLRRTQALKNCGITHIVSVLDWEFKTDAPLIRGYQHLHIPVDDVEDENLLEWFPQSNAFIETALKGGPELHGENVVEDEISSSQNNGVYVHCAMGKSRSATIILAYLLWKSREQSLSHRRLQEEMITLPSQPLTVIKALELLRQGRPIAEPNEGFMDQLHMFEDMNCPTTKTELTSHKIYRRWMNKRRVEESLRTMQAPEMEHIIFEDEPFDGASTSSENTTSVADHMIEVAPGIRAPDGLSESKTASHSTLQSMPQVTIKCRKCRHGLATTPFINEHKPPPHRDPSLDTQPISSTNPLPPPQCAHIFLQPLSWMREVLSEGKLEGRLSCPNTKCGTNIGKFAWTGLRCSCGGWVTPGFGLVRNKVDEIVSARQHSEVSGVGSTTASGIRLPPSMRNRGNL